VGFWLVKIDTRDHRESVETNERCTIGASAVPPLGLFASATIMFSWPRTGGSPIGILSIQVVNFGTVEVLRLEPSLYFSLFLPVPL